MIRIMSQHFLSGDCSRAPMSNCAGGGDAFPSDHSGALAIDVEEFPTVCTDSRRATRAPAEVGFRLLSSGLGM